MQPAATTPEPVPSPTTPPFAARALSAVQREVATALLLVEVVACALLSPQFLTGRNLLGIADDASVYGLIAAGQMLVILSGGIDLSVGSFIAVGAFFAAVMSHHGVLLAVVVPLAVTGLLGLVNGLGAAYTRVPPFIITLAMLSVARGFFEQSAAIYQGASTAGAGASAVSAANTGLFPAISQGTPFGGRFPLQFDTVIALLVFAGLAYALRYSRFGRHVFAIGGNEAAAALLGVRVRRVKLAIYTISGVLAGLGGVLLASRLTSAPAIAGQGYELDAITAVVVGGTLLTGGVGTVRGTLVGLLIVRILPDIFNLRGLDVAWQQVATGGVLLAVVLLQLLVVPAGRIGGLRLRTGRPRPPAPQAAA